MPNLHTYLHPRVKGMQNRHLPPLLRFIPQFAQICIIFALSKYIKPAGKHKWFSHAQCCCFHLPCSETWNLEANWRKRTLRAGERTIEKRLKYVQKTKKLISWQLKFYLVTAMRDHISEIALHLHNLIALLSSSRTVRGNFQGRKCQIIDKNQGTNPLKKWKKCHGKFRSYC